MRFKKIDSFKIGELLLDKGNYRFQRAVDQDDCIAKIYENNKAYFENLMESIADDDLGEPLLVYADPETKDNVVLDGNRRTAAIKVLNRPDLAPSPRLKKKAQQFQSTTKFDFSNIHAQVSSDKELILKTVYERHAAGQGKSRLDWSALATAKFRFNEKQLSDGQDWYEIALLMELESREENALEYVYDRARKRGYSHEVFRRIVRAAISKGVIDKEIFSDRDKRLKTSKKAKISQALETIKKFLAYMEAGEISLSRNGDKYADRDKIDKYLSTFPVSDASHTSPKTDEQDTKEQVGEQQKPEATSDGDKKHPSKEGTYPTSPASNPTSTTQSETSDETLKSPEDGATFEKLSPPKAKKIQASEAIIRKLNELDSRKLSSLYNSLTSITLRDHPALSIVGAWSFFESIAKGLGAGEKESFVAHLNRKNNEWFPTSNAKQSVHRSLTAISEEGNDNKHSHIFVTIDATSLVVRFEVLEELIVRSLEELIEIKAQKK